MKKIFGLVGRSISYSFSQKYFSEKFQKLDLDDYSYQIFDLQNIEEISKVLDIEELVGFNVTIPYKEKIIPYLDELSEEAQKIGAVNTVLLKNGILKGYNTDSYGFQKTLLKYKLPNHQSAMILGNGGVAKAVQFVLNQYNIPFFTVSRQSKINFENLTASQIANTQIIVQCTPVGTFPNVDDCLLFDFSQLNENHLVIDLIYNPNETAFMKKAKKMGAKTANGYLMLEQQAEKAWEIWNSSNWFIC